MNDSSDAARIYQQRASEAEHEYTPRTAASDSRNIRIKTKATSKLSEN